MRFATVALTLKIGSQITRDLYVGSSAQRKPSNEPEQACSNKFQISSLVCFAPDPQGCERFP
jgi:hypothetical protein